MSRHLVLAGGGHAHLTVLSRMDRYVRRGHRVTLVSPSHYHYYSGMGPGLLGGSYLPEEARFDVRRMVEARGGAYVAGAVTGIDPQRRRLHLASGEELSYDVVSFNIGSEVPMARIGASGDGVIPVKPIVRLVEAREELLAGLGRRQLRLLVVGGGPAGVELAGNLWRVAEESGGRAEIALVTGSELLGRFPGAVRELARDSLVSRGVQVMEGARAVRVRDGRALLDDGRASDFDFAFVAVGVVPGPLFARAGLPTGADGGLLVDVYLQAVDHPGIFGGGDCIAFRDRPLDKVGVYAVRQNPILYHNLLAALEGRPLVPFVPQQDYMLIFNLGDGRGIYRKRGRVADGRMAFRVKDWIDRRFMRRFQLSGERSEEGR